jgi:4-amino-4-deoxy-L-arabinose transferase-like glycosyltransferase
LLTALRPPKLFFLLLGLLLLWVYCYRVATNTLAWEEPRRCLVATEMIHRGDYIVPLVLGEPYYNKPPLQNWATVLATGNDTRRVGPLPLRAISILSLVGIAIVMHVLRRGQGREGTDWLPPLIFLTMGITAQYGGTGELDPLLAFWVCAALAAFETGRRSGRPWLQWGVSQALLAAGILTKGLAPLFFYVPVFYRMWADRPRTRFPVRAFAGGLVAELAIVSAWLIPYASRAPAGPLGSRAAQELLGRTPLRQSGWSFVSHLFSYPLEVLADTLPWSLLALLWLLPEARETMRERLRSDSLLRLSVSVTLWGFFVLLMMPGAKGRYMMPVYPFAAVVLAHVLESAAPAFGRLRSVRFFRWVERVLARAFIDAWWGWAALAAAWGVGLLIEGHRAGTYPVLPPLLAGLAAIAIVGLGVRRLKRNALSFGGLLLLGLLYAVSYAGTSRVQRAERDWRYVAEAAQVASAVESTLPVVVGADVPYVLSFYVSHELDRPLQLIPPRDGSYYLITSTAEPDRADALSRHEAGRFTLWEVPSERHSDGP